MVETRSDSKKNSIDSNFTLGKNTSLKSSLDHNNISEISFPKKRASGSSAGKKSTKNTSGLIESSAITSKKKSIGNESIKKSQYSKLYGNLSLKNPNLTKLARFYYNSYNKNNAAGLCNLIQLIFDIANCKFSVNKKIVTQSDPSIFINKIDTSDENLTHNLGFDDKAKLFKLNFLNFIDELFNVSKDDIIYDGVFCETLILWLESFSKSSIRSFRYSATLFACTMISSLIKIFNGLKRSLLTKPRVTNKKSSNSVLNKSFTLIENHSHSIEELITAILTGIFSLRYRDVVADIRKVCIQSLGEWIQSCGTIFMKNENLKFIGWMLNDRTNSVRLKSIHALLKIVETCDISNITVFINRFKERIFEMCYDISDDIACIAIQIVILLHSKNVKISAQKMHKILLLVYSNSYKISRNASLFLIQYIQNKNKPDDLEFNLVKDLILFHSENNMHEITDVFVASIVNQTQETMPSIFLQNIANLLNEDLDDKFETTTIKILESFFKNLYSSKNQIKTRGKISDQAKTKQDIAIDILSEYLLKWLEKYSNEHGKISIIVSLCKYIPFDTVTTEIISSILEKLNQIILKSNFTDDIEACASAYEQFQTLLPSHSSLIKNSISLIITRLNSMFSNRDKNMELFTSSLIKFCSISKFINIVDYDVKHNIDYLFNSDIMNKNEIIVKNGLVFSFLYIVWEYVNLRSASNELASTHLEMRSLFLQKLVSLYEREGSTFEIRKTCFLVLCDFSLLHLKQIKSNVSIKKDFIIINSIFSQFLNELCDSEEETMEDIKNDFNSFMKLIYYEILDENTSALIFQFFNHKCESLNEIIIESLSSLVENNINHFFNIFFIHLQTEFREFLNKHQELNRFLESVKSIIDHFVSIHDHNEYDKVIFKFIKKIIDYVFSEVKSSDKNSFEYLRFLNIISCFHLKDKASIKTEIFDFLITKIDNKSIAEDENLKTFVKFLKLESNYSDFCINLKEEIIDGGEKTRGELIADEPDSIINVQSKIPKTVENTIELENITLKNELPHRVRKRPTGAIELYETDNIEE